MAQNEVILLYEGDEWLSTDSLVLMGIFTSKESFKANAEKLIRQRAKQHLRDAEDNGWEFDGCTTQDKKDAVCEDILTELCSRGSTSGWTTNYTHANATLDELEEI